MGKRNNKWARQLARPLPTDGAAYFGTQVQEGPSWDWGQPYLVRYMGAAAAKKTYTCPGCNQTIPPPESATWWRGPSNQAEDRTTAGTGIVPAGIVVSQALFTVLVR